MSMDQNQIDALGRQIAMAAKPVSKERLIGCVQHDCAACEAQEAQMRRLEAEVEQLRVQLAGCGAAAMQNTEASKEQRAKPGDYGWSSSYGEVCAAVDREIALREANAELLEALKLADALLWGANMNAHVVEEKVRAAIQKHGRGA